MTAYGTTGGPFPGSYEQNLPGDASSPWHDTVSAVAPSVLLGADATTTPITTPAIVGGAVSKVTYTPAADITGADTNTRTVALKNGSVVIATYTFSAGNNATSGVPKIIPITGPTKVDSAAALSWVSTHVGSGLADPGGTVTVHVADRNSAAVA